MEGSLGGNNAKLGRSTGGGLVIENEEGGEESEEEVLPELVDGSDDDGTWKELKAAHAKPEGEAQSTRESAGRNLEAEKRARLTVIAKGFLETLQEGWTFVLTKEVFIESQAEEVGWELVATSQCLPGGEN